VKRFESNHDSRATKLGLAAVATLAIVASSAPAHAQFNPAAERCTFEAPTSFYGWQSDVRTAGRLTLQWSPVTGEIFDYKWYFDPYAARPVPATSPSEVCWDPALERAKHEGEARIYSKLNQECAAWNKVTKTPASSSHFVAATLETYLRGGLSASNHMIHAQMNPAYGGNAEWHFSGILEQTGTSWISAGGKVTCR
jgi:hypothetical protein